MNEPAEIAIDQLDLARYVRAGDVVVCGQDSAEPLSLTEALLEQQPRIGAFTVFVGFLVSRTFDPARAPGIRYESFGALAQASRLARAGRLAVAPCHYSQLPELFASGRFRADVTLLSVSPPGPGGRLSLGTSHEYVIEAAKRARVVITEMNERMPYLHGAEVPADLRIDAMVRSDRALPQVAVAALGEAERRIAGHVASLVPDGATIQLGLGSVPDAIAAALRNHRHLGVHTGMVTESILPLIESGVVDNSRKPFDRGVTVSGIYVGTDPFYRRLHDDPGFACRPPSHTHAIGTIARIERFISVNTAIEVDLTGRVNSEVADGVTVGGTAGAVDYVRGAQLSSGGRSIVALASTARKGTVSRIVPRCEAVTIAASDVDTVVTEHGIAELKGVTLEERARRLIAIADPAYRDALARSLGG